MPFEDEVSYTYAPHFRGFIFRQVLEEYACTCLTESNTPGRSLAILGDYAKLVAEILPENWGAILREVSNRPLLELEHGFYGTIQNEEAQEIIAAEFADWDNFDQEFEQFFGELIRYLALPPIVLSAEVLPPTIEFCNKSTSRLPKRSAWVMDLW